MSIPSLALDSMHYSARTTLWPISLHILCDVELPPSKSLFQRIPIYGNLLLTRWTLHASTPCTRDGRALNSAVNACHQPEGIGDIHKCLQRSQMPPKRLRSVGILRHQEVGRSYEQRKIFISCIAMYKPGWRSWFNEQSDCLLSMRTYIKVPFKTNKQTNWAQQQKSAMQVLAGR